MISQPVPTHVELWPIERFRFYDRNPRKNDHVVDRMVESIRGLRALGGGRKSVVLTS